MGKAQKYCSYLDFPWGRGQAFFTPEGLLAEISLVERDLKEGEVYKTVDNTLLLQREIKAYLSGKGKDFTVPLDLESVTPYRKKVYITLKEKVPYGKVITYKELSIFAGGSARSVGQAMANNPFSIIIPCHRVVGVNGLGGFGGGLSVKEYLLNLENGVRSTHLTFSNFHI